MWSCFQLIQCWQVHNHPQSAIQATDLAVGVEMMPLFISLQVHKSTYIKEQNMQDEDELLFMREQIKGMPQLEAPTLNKPMLFEAPRCLWNKNLKLRAFMTMTMNLQKKQSSYNLTCLVKTTNIQLLDSYPIFLNNV